MTRYSIAISTRSKTVFEITIMAVSGASTLTDTDVAMNSGTGTVDGTVTGAVDTWRERAAVTEDTFEGGAGVGNNQLPVH